MNGDNILAHGLQAVLLISSNREIFFPIIRGSDQAFKIFCIARWCFHVVGRVQIHLTKSKSASRSLRFDRNYIPYHSLRVCIRLRFMNESLEKLREAWWLKLYWYCAWLNIRPVLNFVWERKADLDVFVLQWSSFGRKNHFLCLFVFLNKIL